MLEICMTIAVSVIIGFVAVGLIIKKAVANIISEEKAINIVGNALESLMDQVLTDKELQAKTYQIGALLGAGFARAIPMLQRGGKFKIEDILAGVFGGVAQKFLKGSGEGAPGGNYGPPQNSNTIQP